MKSMRFLLLIALVGGTPLYSQDEPRPQLEFGTSVLWGNAYELVLRDGTYRNPISQLTWPVSPSVAVEVRASLPWNALTSTRVGLRASRPLTSGTLVDEDWNYGTIVYYRSEHQSYLTAHLSGDIEQQIHWERGAFSLGALYRWSNWEGWNGTYRYQDTTTTEGVYGGLVLAYRQEWLIPYLGAQWTFPVAGWDITPSARVSSLSWGYARDDHLLVAKRNTYLDYPTGGVYGRLAAEASFRDARGWEWGARGAWEIAYGAVGNSIQTAPSKDFTTVFPSSKDSAGAWFEEAAFTLFVRN